MNLKWLASFYLWFWFHTEFWLTPINRRPYTFIIRDWIYPHMALFLWLVLAVFIGLINFAQTQPLTSIILSCLSSLLCAHLVWGSAWIEGEQETPEYLGGKL